MSSLQTQLVDNSAANGSMQGARPYRPAGTRPPALALVKNRAPDPAAATNASATPRLTSRQSEVLCLLCEGLSDKLIARRLELSHHTVRGHVQIVYNLLQVSSRMQAMLAARAHGLVS